MKKIVILLFAASLFVVNPLFGQCDSEVCNGNTGLYSNDDAASIAYDNMGAAYHASYIREPNGSWRAWGAYINNVGSGNFLSPTTINSTTYPALTGTIYKIGIGDLTQMVILTSTGLFVVGREGAVLGYSITTTSAFRKITVAGKADGLPLNVVPTDVKILFVSTGTLMITTCTGEVYVLSQNSLMRENTGTESDWVKIMQDPTTPLSNVIVSRGSGDFGFALKSDGTLWTWGQTTYLGDGTAPTERNFATPMTLPAGIPGIKMIQGTFDNSTFDGTPSYYVLGTDKKVYSLGGNDYGQLGDNTSVERYAWVNCKNPNSSIITDAAWISANEHDNLYPGLSVIKAGGLLYTAGVNSYYMAGRAIESGTNYLNIPAGIQSTDVITHCETGGHSTAVIKLGSIRYGYVGHRISGSMGDGSSLDMNQTSFDFITPPIVAVCGTLCTTPVVTTNSPICPGQDAIFTITGTPGDVVSYKINNGSTLSIVIGTTGTATVTIASAAADQTINLVYILGATGTCSNNLSTAATVSVGGNVSPLFTQVPSICQGQTLNPLPTTSNNGVTGTWSPPLNNQITTNYTFTPSSSGSCLNTANMTIVVSPTGSVPTFSIPTTICEGEVLLPLPTSSNEQITGSWSPAPNNLTTTDYTFTPSAGTCINNVPITINVNPRVTPLFTQVNPICVGDTLTLPTQSNNNVTGTWSPSIDNNNTTTYTFTPSATSLCTNNATMTIVVNPKVDPTFTTINPICEGDALSPLPLVSNNSFSGTWSPSINNLATTTYTFTPNVGVCSNPKQITITVNPKVTPTFTPVATACYGSSINNLPLTSNNSIQGTWSPVINNTQTTTYTFTPNTGECANTDTLKIDVYNEFDFEYKGYCDNADFYLQITPKNQSFDGNTASYTWQLNNQTVSTSALFDVTSYLNGTPTIETLPLNFTIKVINSNGCAITKNIMIDNVFCGVQKGISVNNDDKNDFFDLQLLNVKHLSIFNRYGMKVYSKDNYLKEWKGQKDDGTILPDGTYFYVIDFNDNRQESKTGWIYLLREN